MSDLFYEDRIVYEACTKLVQHLGGGVTTPDEIIITIKNTTIGFPSWYDVLPFLIKILTNGKIEQ